MVSKKMTEKITEQVNKELFSAYLYMAMSSWANRENWKGLAKWLFVQAQEESCHALILYRYLGDQQQHCEMLAIQQPQGEYKSALNVFEEVQRHEQLVTASIGQLVALARAENDYATEAMLQWFVTEQVEEEANAADAIAKLKLAGASAGGLYILDKEFGARVFQLPAPLATAGLV